MAVAPDAEASGPAAVGRQQTTVESQRTSPFSRALGGLRVVFGALLFLLVVWAALRSWDDVRATLARIGVFDLALAFALVLAGLGASVLTWRVAARELGSSVRVGAASKIYLIGQLGKYLPGGFWALAVQMELARTAGVPRSRGVTASVVAIGVNVLTGLAVGLVVVPGALDTRTHWMAAILAVLLVGLVLLSPPVLTRIVTFALHLARRPEAGVTVTWRGIVEASGWSVASWACYGLSLWILAVAVGAPAGEAFFLCLGGMALSMTLGFLVVVAPSGIGVREAVIVAVLAPVLERPEALAVALVARLLFTLADLSAAAAVVPVKMRPTRSGQAP